MSETNTKDEWVPTQWQLTSQLEPNYELLPVTIDRMVSPFYEGVRYAVRRGQSVLGLKSGRFEYEVRPSERDDAFYAAYRFRSFEAAQVAASAAIAAMLAESQRRAGK